MTASSMLARSVRTAPDTVCWHRTTWYFDAPRGRSHAASKAACRGRVAEALHSSGLGECQSLQMAGTIVLLVHSSERTAVTQATKAA